MLTNLIYGHRWPRRLTLAFSAVVGLLLLALLVSAWWLVVGILLVAGVIVALPFVLPPVETVSIRKAKPRADDDTDVPLAGLAECDITPPVGIPKFGYSTLAKSSDGFRTRLKARVLYLKAPGEPAMALVQTDLGTGSLILHHAVAERIAAETDVDAARLTIFCTHTHSGPGQFLGSDFYNVFGTNKPGFDPTLFEFLVGQISGAVMAARENRRPARFATGRRRVWGLTRNRSVGAWARNFDIPRDKITADMQFRAVNPDMIMLRVDQQADDGEWHPAGAFTTFSIHGTAIPAFRKPVHADVWAWFSTGLSQRIRREHNPPWQPLHAAVQATHGDNNPAWRQGERGDLEAQRIGTQLAREAWQLFQSLEGKTEATLATAMASREMDLLDLPTDQRHGLAPRAVMGMPVVGAAKGDDLFPASYLAGFQAGWPRCVFTGGPQGAKRWMLSKLQLAVPADRFPHLALLQVVRINDLVLVPVPWEVTLETGNRMREQVREALPEGDWLVEITSIANGYFGYATTPAEYGAQYYEGGHTIYGPGTMEFLTRQSRRLAEDLFQDGPVDDLPEQWQFRLRRHVFWPGTKRWSGRREVLQPPSFHTARGHNGSYFAFEYRDVGPGELELHKPLLAVEEEVDGEWRALAIDGVTMDDESTRLQIRHLGNDDADGARYEARWYVPTTGCRPGRYRFRIEPRGEQPAFFSPVFADGS